MSQKEGWNMTNRIIVILIIAVPIVAYTAMYYSSEMPLVDAIVDNNISYVEEKLKEGFDPNYIVEETNYYKYFHRGVPGRPMFWFSQTPEMLELFIRYGAEIDKEHSHLGWTLLTQVADVLSPQNEKIVRTLLKHGADPFYIRPNGMFGLWAEIFHDRSYDHHELLVLLLEYIKDINKVDNHGDTILIYQISACHKKNVDFLLAQGADPYIKNKNGKNAFDIAKEVHCKEILLP